MPSDKKKTKQKPVRVAAANKKGKAKVVPQPKSPSLFPSPKSSKTKKSPSAVASKNMKPAKPAAKVKSNISAGSAKPANSKTKSSAPLAKSPTKGKATKNPAAPSSAATAHKSASKSSKIVPTTKIGLEKTAKPSKSTLPAAVAPKSSKSKEKESKTKPVANKHPLGSAAKGSTKATVIPTPSIPTPSVVARPIAARKAADPPAPKKSDTNPDIVAKIRSAQAVKELRKDLAQTPPKKTITPITKVPPVVKGQDRIILMVRDPYWLHAHWDITRQTVDRAKAALAEHWHAVKPVLRLLKLEDNGTTESAESVYRDLEIHGGVRNWYIDVDHPPSRFQIVMGYMTGAGRFYELVRSNTVSTPVPGGKEASDDHWADIAKDAERIYAMSGGYGDETQRGELPEVFEERLNRTMDIDVLSQFGSGAESGLRKPRQFHFDVDAEIIVFGSTHPDAHVSIGTDPIKVRNDGSFSIRLPFPDRRQVLPATARSRDGVDEQTVVIAVERNTKVMEPLSMEGEEP